MNEGKILEKYDIKDKIVESIDKFKSEMGTSLSEAKDYIKKEFRDFIDPFYTNYTDRYNKTPTNSCEWLGERAESKCIPLSDTEDGQKAIEKLKEYGLDGIVYKNCEPDFSKCSEGTVQIDDMNENRHGHNFLQANKKLAEEWNKQNKDGRNDWTDKDVYKFRKENKLIWHECCDTKTMHLVPYDIHSFFKHSGGVAECKVRDNKDLGSGFDD